MHACMSLHVAACRCMVQVHVLPAGHVAMAHHPGAAARPVDRHPHREAAGALLRPRCAALGHSQPRICRRSAASKLVPLIMRHAMSCRWCTRHELRKVRAAMRCDATPYAMPDLPRGPASMPCHACRAGSTWRAARWRLTTSPPSSTTSSRGERQLAMMGGATMGPGWLACADAEW